MDEIVRVCQLDQYFTADDHVYMKEALDTRLRAISEESADVVTEEAVAALKALAKKVAAKDFPPDGSEAVLMAQTVIKTVEYLADSVKSTGSNPLVSSKQEESAFQRKLQRAAFKAFCSCFEYGPTSGHLELIQDFLKSSFIDLRGFIKSLDLGSEELQKLLSALKRDYNPRDTEKDFPRYRMTTSIVVKTILDLVPGSHEVMNIRRKEIMELYFHALRYSALPREESSRIHQETIDLLHKKFSPDSKDPSECFIFSSCKTGTILNGYVAQFTDHIRQKNFPPQTMALDVATECLKVYLVTFRGKTELPISDAVKIISFLCIFKKQPLLAMAKSLSSDARFFDKESITNQKRSILQVIREETELLVMDQSVNEDLMQTIQNLYSYLAFPAWTDKIDSSLIVPCLPWLLRCKHQTPLKICLEVFRTKGKLINWKSDIDSAKHMLTAFCDVMTGPYLNHEDMWREVVDVKEMLHLFLHQIKVTKAMEKLHTFLLQMIHKSLDNPTLPGSTILPKFEEFIDTELALPNPSCSDCDVCKKSMKALVDLLEKCIDLLENPQAIKYVPNFDMAVTNILQCIITQISEHRQAHEFTHLIYRILRMLHTGPYEDEDGKPKAKVLLTSPALVFVNANCSNPAAIATLVPSLLHLCSCEYTQVRELMSQIGLMALKESPQVLEGHLNDLLQMLQIQGYSAVISCIKSMYMADVDREPIHEKLLTLVELIPRCNMDNRLDLMVFLINVAKKSGHSIKAEHLMVLKQLYVHPEMLSYSCELFTALSSHNPQVIVECKQLVYSMAHSNEKYAANTAMILTQVAISVKEIREEVINYLLECCLADGSSDRVIYLGRLKALAIVDPDMMERHRSTFEELKQDPNLNRDSIFIIHVIDNKESLRSLGSVSTLQEEFERSMSSLMREYEELKRSSFSIPSVSETSLEARESGSSMPDTNVDPEPMKITDIDAVGTKPVELPAWWSELNKQLQIGPDSDWQLLASELGFTQEYIDEWSAQPDPCWSVLQQWYRTYEELQDETREDATRDVINAFYRMQRVDLAQFIENYEPKIVQRPDSDTENINVNNSVANAKTTNTAFPVVYISYDQADVDKCKLLKDHLTSAGYECMLHISKRHDCKQVLNDVSFGLRKARVILACVSEHYIGSKHCEKEIRLASGLGKPIIPVVLESVTSSHNVRIQCLPIEFYISDATVSTSKVFWSDEQMQQLLVQISYTVAPCVENIASGEPKRWWTVAADSVPDAYGKDTSHASIYLSYEWDKQSVVKQLRRGLMSLGYNCWMDVFALSGSEPLVEQAERALHQADIVISCVTTRYSHAEQCRRDVALASTLNKPMVVLVLESTDWPPTAGPMQEALNNQTYINCVDAGLQRKWIGVQFDELVVRLSSMWQAIKSGKATGVAGGASRDQAEFNARQQWKKVHNIGRAAVAFNNPTSKACVIM